VYQVIITGHAVCPDFPHELDFFIGSFEFDVCPVGMGPAPAAHHATHEDSGSDEIDISGLVGNPDPHKASHELGGSDEPLLTGLSGLLADEQTPLPHFHDKHLGLLWYSDAPYASSLHPWYTAAIASGTFTEALGEKDHPGICRLLSSINANSGYRITVDLSSLLLSGTEETIIVFRPLTLAGTTLRLGFRDNQTSADVVDGVYLEMSQVGGIDGVIVGKTSNNSARSTTGTDYTLTTNTWYRLSIAINSDASLATFSLYSAACSLLWSDSLSTNIPTARNTGHGIVATNSGTTAVQLIDVDYINLSIDRTLVR
jgi:hypothetical protein